jgi:flavin reductase (DIM6/NTAB) family NADH-FMN oxidoreductase RutF
VEFDPEKIKAEAVYKLLIGCVVPRPIAWVSTVDADGVKNVAPFSFFMAITGDPPTIAFSSSVRAIAPAPRRRRRTRSGTSRPPGASWSTSWTTPSPSR